MEHAGVAYLETGLSLFGGSQAELKRYQQEKFISILNYAEKHVPYYKNLFSHMGLFEDGGLNEEKIGSIPILTRELIREHTEELKGDEFDALRATAHSSSGSTGTPLRVYHCSNQLYCGKEDKLLFGYLNGKKPGDFWVKFWGNEDKIPNGIMKRIGERGHRYSDYLLLDASNLSEEKILTFIEEIQKEKPVMIWAYADPIFHFSRYLLSHAISLHNPKCIITTGSMLSPKMKATIRQAFPWSKVANQYGANEVGTIASEVDGEEGLRLFEHSLKFEVLHEDGTISNDGRGELLVTTLNNRAMPLIRYKIGDRLAITHDLGDRKGSFGLITSLEGKSSVHLKKADGGLVFGQFFLDLFCEQEWIERFLIIQKSYTAMEIHLVVRRGFERDESSLNQILKKIDLEMGTCEYSIIYEPIIKPLPSGKYEYIRPLSH